jgi:hypothetical protein
VNKLILSGVLAALVSGCAATPVNVPAGAELGVKGDARLVMREVVITPQTRWVNVESGETVRFSAAQGSESVIWYFDTPSWSTGRLGDIAPKLAQGRDIPIYVAMPRLYMPDI